MPVYVTDPLSRSPCAEETRSVIAFAARFARLIALLGYGLSLTRIAIAQQSPDDVIQARVANYREMGTAMKQIRDELTLSRPDPRKIRQAAQVIHDRGSNMLRWFPPGSEPAPEPAKDFLETILGWFSSDVISTATDNIKSHAKEAVWTQAGGFEQAYSKFYNESTQLLSVTQSSQIPVIASQAKRLEQTCKSCHDTFREKID